MIAVAATPFVSSCSSMKRSMDKVSTPDTPAQISQAVQVLAQSGCKYIAVETPFDDLAYMTEWMNAVHAAGLKVYHRSHFAAWESAAGMNPADYATQYQAWLTANEKVFADGDIIDGCPEPENGMWFKKQGNDWTYNPAKANIITAYNLFIQQITAIGRQVFGDTVIVNRRSTNGFFATHPKVLYEATVQANDGIITCDPYPESSAPTPENCIEAWDTFLKLVLAGFPGAQISIGEFGIIHSDLSDAAQAAVYEAVLPFLGAEYANVIVGLNNWCGVGEQGQTDQWSRLTSGSPGAWTARPAMAAVSAYFAQVV